jgi:hypothetical protein
MLALSATCSASLASSRSELRAFSQIKTERVVIGAVADISAQYESGTPITVVHILEFSTDLPPQTPKLLQVRVCGDQRNRLQSALHTNITLVYNLASQTRLTGCFTLISSDPWKDSSRWQTVTPRPTE